MKPVIIITIALVLFISLIIGLIILIYSNNENIAIEKNLDKPSFFMVEAYDDWPDNYRKWDKNLSWHDFLISQHFCCINRIQIMSSVE